MGFDLKINTTTRMIERCKMRIVANGQTQILGFDCYDVHVPTIPMAEIKLLLAICAHHDIELCQSQAALVHEATAANKGQQQARDGSKQATAASKRRQQASDGSKQATAASKRQQ